MNTQNEKTENGGLEDLALEVTHGVSRAVELTVQRGTSHVVSLSLDSDEAFELAELLQRHAVAHNNQVDAFLSRGLGLASFVAGPATLQ